MKTDVTILHHEYPTTTRDHVVAKLQHLVRFYEGTVSVRAVLERQHDDHRVELVANVRRGVVLVIDAHAGSITAALDEAVDRMGRVLSRHKGKLVKGRRKSRARAS
jgi:ribosomal subunit interface protein